MANQEEPPHTSLCSLQTTSPYTVWHICLVSAFGIVSFSYRGFFFSFLCSFSWTCFCFALFSFMSRLRRYRRYLRFPQWRAKRMQVFALYGRKCRKCGSTKKLEVNHKHYHNIFNERLEDLEVLCRSCHEEYHGIAPVTGTKRQKRARRRFLKEGHAMTMEEYRAAPHRPTNIK